MQWWWAPSIAHTNDTVTHTVFIMGVPVLALLMATSDIICSGCSNDRRLENAMSNVMVGVIKLATSVITVKCHRHVGHTQSPMARCGCHRCVAKNHKNSVTVRE